MLIDLNAVALDGAALDALAARLRLPDGAAADPAAAPALREALEAARAVIERETGRALTERRFRVVADDWGEGPEVPVGPVAAVLAVALIDAEGVETPLAPEDFRIDPFADPARIRAAWAATPRVPTGGHVAAEVEAGYGPGWEDVPWDLRAATLAQAAALWERGASQDFGGGLAPEAAALVAPYRRMRL